MCKRYLLIGLVLSMLVFSCTSDVEKVTTESGIEVTYFRTGDGPSPVSDQIMLLHMIYAIPEGDTLFDTRFQGQPVPITFVAESQAGLLYEPLAMLKQGDSVSFQIPAQDLFENTFRSQVPPSIEPTTNIQFSLGLERLMTEAEYNDYLLDRDLVVIDKYLSENQIEAQTTDTGLRYIITQDGEGEFATQGQKVTVHYNGTLLDGTKFDSSYDRGQPFSFVLGTGNVIKGWDEGIGLLNKGAKATLYIPSSLAYGARQMGPTIAPYSILKFEVELLEMNDQ